MKKIPTIFYRYRDGKEAYVFNMQHPDCDWVFNGEGGGDSKV